MALHKILSTELNDKRSGEWRARSHCMYLCADLALYPLQKKCKVTKGKVRVNPFPIPRLLMTLKKEPFENNVGKGENAGNQHFPLLPQCFLPFPK